MRSPRQNQQPLAYNIELVDKVVRLLETLRDAPEGLTLQTIATRTGYVKSSIHRTLGSLKYHGYVEQPTTGGPYRLGIKCLLLASGLKDSVELLPLARPHLQDIVDALDESAYLAILRGGRGVFVDVCETRRRELRLVGPLGAGVHFHATAAGKAIAAYLPQPAREGLLRRLELTSLTPRTRTRRAEVAQEWREVARRGVAINHEETIVGAIFIAGALFDADHAVCGSLSVGIPKARYTPALGRTISARVKDACARLSASLAQVGYLHEDRELHDLR
jgi:IclR family transcriptional regulator, KDG regulon repressor